MSDLKLFRFSGGPATELTSSSAKLEKSLQEDIERNMETLFGARLLASEYSTGAKHGGRIDSLGLDENYSPVIFEYKRATNENVINQGLFYLDWLLDHRGEFELLVMKRLGSEDAKALDWSNPRLICVANGFTRYDEHAVLQINRSIELVRYRKFEPDLLALELVISTKPDTATGAPPQKVSSSPANAKTVTELLDQASTELRDLYAELERYCESLGDDVTKKVLKNYFAFRRLKNFACVEVHPLSKNLLVYLKIDPDTIELAPGFSRDVRSIGHFGTGDLELRIKSPEDLERALPLVQRSYEAS
ncbi:DUF91 domain-containing protein [Actinomadura soli]|uniref:DUF91 domain-containing protein n=1 Tax=Actinomadura soli TaxID=2508997 RepID=A0A5C4JH31_9ACTN|nr:DUF5655 domain-containing protein [Actinomadura soli]TMR03374.1 DUF91 domain-containing protein [Actinomadura soli]